jgi:Protein of unknown function (DUF2628)
MAVYTVHEPPLRSGAVAPDPERFVFVRDGFYIWAFLLTPLWLIWNKLWLVLLIYLVATFGIAQAMHQAGVQPVGRSLVMLLISFLIGLEAGTLRRFTLARRGFRNVGLVSGTNMEAAERRFFSDWAAGGPGRPSGSTGYRPPPLPPSPVATAATAFHAPPIVGLFPEPGASR